MQGPYFLFFTCLMVLPFFLSDVSTASLLAATPNVVGGYQPIKDVDDPRIIGIAEFAVEEYNKKGATRTLEFINVVKGSSLGIITSHKRLPETSLSFRSSESISDAVSEVLKDALLFVLLDHTKSWGPMIQECLAKTMGQ
ncbi:hypothetical protein Ancab_037176 [Ancistrocladus abbreviatus]